MRTAAPAASHYVVSPHRGEGPHSLIDTGDYVRTTKSGIPTPVGPASRRTMAKLICPAAGCFAWATAADVARIEEVAAAVPVSPGVRFTLTRV